MNNTQKVKELKFENTYKVQDHREQIKYPIEEKEDNRPYYVSPLEVSEKTFIPNTKQQTMTYKPLIISGIDRVYNITGKDDKIENQTLLPVYLPENLDGNSKNMKLYQINFGHTVLDVPNTILTIQAAVDNSLYKSSDQKERMLKALHRVLKYELIFNKINAKQLGILTTAIDALNMSNNYIDTKLPRFISYELYKEYTSSVNIFLLNTITEKPLVVSKRDGSKIPIYLTDIVPLLKKGYELDLGASQYTELDNQIELNREIELGLDVYDTMNEVRLRNELAEILD